MHLPSALHTHETNLSFDRSAAQKRKSRTDSETTALELQQVQSRLIKAKKDAYRLGKVLAKSTTHNKTEVQAGDRRSAPVSPSPDAILGDWVAQERPRKDGAERTWALSRKPSSNGSSAGKKETSTRSTSGPVGGRSAAAAATSKGLGPRPGKHAFVVSMLLSSTGLPTIIVFEGTCVHRGR